MSSSRSRARAAASTTNSTSSLNSNSAFVSLTMDSSDRLLFTVRAATGAQVSADVPFAGSFGGWVQLYYIGETDYAYTSLDGNAWTLFREVNIPELRVSRVYVGLVNTSGDPTRLQTFTPTNVMMAP